MPSVQIEFSVTLESLECANCGMTYALPAMFISERRKDHRSFYCPAGHSQHFPQESPEEKLTRELKRYQRRVETLTAEVTFERDQKEATERSLRATKGQLTKTKQRIAHGVCPCCKRTFQDLARHMAGKHPEYEESNS